MTVESHSNAKTEGTIPFSAFPENVQDKLKELDLSGDGKIDAKEIIAGMQALQREKQKTRQLLLMLSVLGVLMCVLLAAICGLLFAVIELTKESKIGSDSVMLVKGKNDPVRVASTDFTVINGVLSSRDSRANQTCGGGVCPSNPIQVSEVQPPIMIHRRPRPNQPDPDTALLMSAPDAPSPMSAPDALSPASAPAILLTTCNTVTRRPSK
jgi:hypothetical protein